MKSALDWLKKNEIDFEFHDYKSRGITEEKLKDWSRQIGWENLVNKRGTTWRQLDEETQSEIVNESSAIELMKEKTSVIKRPLIENNGKVFVLGFDEENYSSVFSKTKK